MPYDDSLDHASPGATAHGRHFPVTHWELVARVREGGEARRAALEQLCQLYWYPIYAFLRREGRSREDAEDLTQSFFLKVLSGETFDAANPEKGKLRTFLLHVLKRHVADQFRRDMAEKRGGRQALARAVEDAEARYIAEPVDGLDPETLYLRGWCRQILKSAAARLRESFTRTGQGPLYDALFAFLEVGDARTPYHDLAASTGLSVGTLRQHIFRLRQKYRALVKDEIAQTVTSPAELESELKWFASMMAGG